MILDDYSSETNKNANRLKNKINKFDPFIKLMDSNNINNQ